MWKLFLNGELIVGRSDELVGVGGGGGGGYDVLSSFSCPKASPGDLDYASGLVQQSATTDWSWHHLQGPQLLITTMRLLRGQQTPPSFLFQFNGEGEGEQGSKTLLPFLLARLPSS